MLGFALLILAIRPAQVTAGVVFTKVADTTTLIPDGTGSFTSLGNPSIDNGRVVFVGNGAGGQTGIYEYYGGKLTMRVNQSTPMPGGTGGFTKFDAPSLEGTDIAFQAEGSAKQAGIYTQFDGNLAVIADTTTPIPSAKGNFRFPSSPVDRGLASLSDRTVSFMSATGIYVASNGNIVPVVTVPPTTATPIPDQSDSFNFLWADLLPQYADGQLVMGGRNVDYDTGAATSGIYQWSELAGLRTIVDQNSILPGMTTAIGDFFAIPRTDDGTTFVSIIRAYNLDALSLTLGPVEWRGLYRLDAGGLTPVLLQSDLSALRVKYIGNWALDDGRIAFPSYDRDIWTFKDGTLMPVVSAGDVIDGKQVSELSGSQRNQGREFISGNQIAVNLLFTDGSTAIYIATIPEPSTFILTLVAIAGLALATRCRVYARHPRTSRHCVRISPEVGPASRLNHAYFVRSSIPASWNAALRSAHLLQRPQCKPGKSDLSGNWCTGSMHENVSSSGSSRPRYITSRLCK